MTVFKSAFRHNLCSQSGRSMIEMLGVIAIYGTLSLGVYAAVSTLRNSHDDSNAVLSVLNITDELRELFKIHAIWENEDSGINLLDYAIEEGIIKSSAGNVIPPIGESFSINLGEDYYGYELVFGGLSLKQCVDLASADWGSIHHMTVGLHTLYPNDQMNEEASGTLTPYPFSEGEVLKSLCLRGSNSYNLSIGFYP